MEREEQALPDLGAPLFYAYGVLFSEVSRTLFRHDPAGIDFESNPDEYDPEAHDLIARLQNNPARLPTAQLCRQVLERWFSAKTASRFTCYEELARDIDRAWEKFRAQ